MLIAFNFNLIFIPLSIAFDTHLDIPYIFIDVFFYLILLGDIFVRAKTSIDADGNITTKRLDVIHAYVNKHFFIFDILSCIPLDFVLLVSGFSSMIAAWSRSIRFLKIFRISEILGMLRTHANIRLQLFNILVIFFLFLNLMHIVACIYYFIGKYEYELDRRFDSKTLFEDIADRDY